LAENRKILVYIQNSNTTDISPRLAELIKDQGYRVKVLRSGNTETRSDRIDQWVQEGLDVLISNPRLVETGLDLIDFPTLVFYQCGYSIYTLRQASRRSYRITQTEPVKVYFMAYAETLQTKALKLIATKLETSLALEGELTDKGMSALSESPDSMSKELARALLKKIDETGTLQDIWASYRKKDVMNNCRIDGKTTSFGKTDQQDIKADQPIFEIEQTGEITISVSLIEHGYGRKRVSRITVKESELDEIIESRDNPVSVQYDLF